MTEAAEQDQDQDQIQQEWCREHYAGEDPGQADQDELADWLAEQARADADEREDAKGAGEW